VRTLDETRPGDMIRRGTFLVVPKVSERVSFEIRLRIVKLSIGKTMRCDRREEQTEQTKAITGGQKTQKKTRTTESCYNIQRHRRHLLSRDQKAQKTNKDN
jgi:hypothetical protein